ncbi:hypothetical protein SAMN05444161_3401 [Rhizobiales bacterium GAS191]|jgi:hypothetical protein|nr:hypothetical protein SAMN05519103_02520 [Rhizobiales bacterium GAS113]SEB75334.1 hypothetical protein SAMN05519104_0043 [Rhizobiales bacterium GAS188]SED52770.1 hypothetical protein SAMN05444161_3401 [Rhizobiales bacterium GAS191]
MIVSTKAGHKHNKPGSLLQGRRMLDEARPQAGPDAASWSGPAGQNMGLRLEACPATIGVIGEIVVTRAVAGVEITSCEKRSDFLGVVLKAPPPGARRGYAIVLAAMPGGEDLLLARDLDEDEIVAQWRATASSLGLPALLCHADGEMEFLQRQLGAVTLGCTNKARRRKPLAKNRRPRFLMRRKAGRVVTAKR